MKKTLALAFLFAFALTLRAAPLTDADKRLLDRALAPNATAAEKAQAQKLCNKCKPCFNGRTCDLMCIRRNCAR
jgi:hypothetical protein